MQATARMASVVSSTLPARRRLIRVVRPTSMRKLPFIFGALAGIILCGVVAVGLALRSAFDSTDPRYEIVAVSWGNHTNNAELWIYQVQVSATGSSTKRSLDVSARVCLGDGNYFHDIGTIGTASDMGDATKRFGLITWLPDSITIGGADGVKATLQRSELQKHR